MSSPNDSYLRQVVRDTWLKLSTKTPEKFYYIFPIGSKNLTSAQLLLLDIERSKLKNNDIVLFSNFSESYNKLAQKTAISIRYATENFIFKFLLKVDVDSFVRLGSFLKALEDVSHFRLYWGFLDGRAKPFRRGKWKELDWILCDRYLPYQVLFFFLNKFYYKINFFVCKIKLNKTFYIYIFL